MGRRIMATVALVFGLAVASSSTAEIFAPTDYIGAIFLSSAANEAFRVYPRNPATLPASCIGGFAYTNVASDNYQAWVAALMSAYVSGKQVTLAYTVVGSFCEINEFWITG